MEFGFARVDGQAYSLKIAIEKFCGIFKVEFVPDPCDPKGSISNLSCCRFTRHY